MSENVPASQGDGHGSRAQEPVVDMVWPYESQEKVDQTDNLVA